MPDRLRHLFKLLLDAFDFGEDVRLVDVALFGHDPDDGEIASAEDLIEQVGGFDVGMFLRRPQIGVRVHLERPEPCAEKDREAGDRQRDEPWVGENPARIASKPT